MPSEELLQPGQLLGPYQIIERINEGGAAIVYRAHQTSMARDVALKVLKLSLAEQSPAFVERFTREARMVAQLQHPHILPVLDFGQSGNYVYLVMVLLNGGTLRHYLRQQGPLPLSQCAFLIAQIAGALERAHSRGIIHRDLKPENILMDEDRNAYLTDFGIARILENATRLTAAGSILGTPQYMSPEQIRGQGIDQRADVYSLGVMLYEMCVGRLPFHDVQIATVLRQQLSEPPPAPRSINPALPRGVEAVLLKALAKAPDDRYEDALDLAEAFVSALPDAPTISAEQESQAQQLRVKDTQELAALPDETFSTGNYGTQVARLAPARLPDDQQFAITENPADPRAALPLPNGYMHYAIRATEEVAGLQALEVILNFAGLQALLDEYPPQNMKFDRGYTFKQYADLNHAILNYFGANGREAVYHIGRLSSRWQIMDQRLAGFNSMAMRILPLVAAMRLSFNYTADNWRKLWKQVDYDYDLRVIEKENFFLWAARACPFCAGKRCDRPLGWIMEAAFVEGGIIIKGRHLRIKEIACLAQGAPFGVWRIDKKPLERDELE